VYPGLIPKLFGWKIQESGQRCGGGKSNARGLSKGQGRRVSFGRGGGGRYQAKEKCQAGESRRGWGTSNRGKDRELKVHVGEPQSTETGL